jgi:hypothetical protein
MLVPILDPTWASPRARRDDVALRSYRQVQPDAQSKQSCDIRVTDEPFDAAADSRFARQRIVSRK